jgi:polyhydroxyalkanoate synthesis regulator phasin
MFNPLKMAGDMKGMEKMLKPALEKFMKDSGFVKKSELEKLESRIKALEEELHNKD